MKSIVPALTPRINPRAHSLSEATRALCVLMSAGVERDDAIGKKVVTEAVPAATPASPVSPVEICMA